MKKKTVYFSCTYSYSASVNQTLGGPIISMVSSLLQNTKCTDETKHTDNSAV